MSTLKKEITSSEEQKWELEKNHNQEQQKEIPSITVDL
jgi:hypothetical protein